MGHKIQLCAPLKEFHEKIVVEATGLDSKDVALALQTAVPHTQCGALIEISSKTPDLIQQTLLAQMAMPCIAALQQMQQLEVQHPTVPETPVLIPQRRTNGRH